MNLICLDDVGKLFDFETEEDIVLPFIVVFDSRKCRDLVTINDSTFMERMSRIILNPPRKFSEDKIYPTFRATVPYKDTRNICVAKHIGGITEEGLRKEFGEIYNYFNRVVN